MADTSTSIRTFSGLWFDTLDPRAIDVNVRDVAHALSLLCRFTGHVREFYSVAQHSVLVASQVSESNQLWALLHDASEAYVADLNRPLKHAPEMSRYRTAEKHVMLAICERFGLDPKEPAEVKEADCRMCATEMRDLMGGNYVNAKPYRWVITETWDPKRAEKEFLKRFYELRFERALTARTVPV